MEYNTLGSMSYRIQYTKVNVIWNTIHQGPCHVDTIHNIAILWVPTLNKVPIQTMSYNYQHTDR